MRAPSRHNSHSCSGTNAPTAIRMRPLSSAIESMSGGGGAYRRARSATRTRSSGVQTAAAVTRSISIRVGGCRPSIVSAGGRIWPSTRTLPACSQSLSWILAGKCRMTVVIPSPSRRPVRVHTLLPVGRRPVMSAGKEGATWMPSTRVVMPKSPRSTRSSAAATDHNWDSELMTGPEFAPSSKCGESVRNSAFS